MLPISGLNRLRQYNTRAIQLVNYLVYPVQPAMQLRSSSR